MNKPLILLCIAVSAILFSCQKEVSNENSNGGASKGNLLVKSTYKAGTDSSFSLYAYDGSRRLKSLSSSGTSNGTFFANQTNLVRSGTGIIQKINIKNDQFAQLGVDSLVYTVNYDAGTSRYKSKVFAIDLIVTIIKDSVAYEYDAAGKIAKVREFMDDGTTGGYEEVYKTEYTYSGNNITAANTYTFDVATNSYTLEVTETYEYDAKTNALQLGNEGIVIGNIGLYTANNVTKQTVVYPADPSSNQSMAATYTYNSNNRPLTASFVIQPGGSTATSTFFYQ
jgi:hypothetical protein